MDVDRRWGGDTNIVLGVTSLVASIPIQLKDLQVFILARVFFQLADEIPCISDVVVALLADCKNEDEIVAVIAHELGHWKLNHTTYSTVFSISRISDNHLIRRRRRNFH